MNTERPTRQSLRNIVLAAADATIYGKDAWHVMDWNGETFGTYGGRKNAEDRMAARRRTVKGMVTRDANKR
jgi:hypothetical protein